MNILVLGYGDEEEEDDVGDGVVLVVLNCGERGVGGVWGLGLGFILCLLFSIFN